MHLELLEKAKSDILNIRKYTYLTWGEKQTDKYLSSIYKKLDQIATLPYLGRVFYTVNDISYRKIVHQEHIILYFIRVNKVFVYRIKNHYQQN
jgi:plasmid stabilization system protein ParE